MPTAAPRPAALLVLLVVPAASAFVHGRSLPLRPSGGSAAHYHRARALRAMADVPVKIAVTGVNSRRISSSIVIDRGPEDVWKVLTDYDRLAIVIPNLEGSRRLPHPTGGIRIFQEGAQNVVGLDFRASVTMDMQEFIAKGDSQQRKLTFQLHDSFMFEDFSGSRVA